MPETPSPSPPPGVTPPPDKAIPVPADLLELDPKSAEAALSKPPQAREKAKKVAEHPLVKAYKQGYVAGWKAQYVEYQIEQEREKPEEKREKLLVEKEGCAARIKKLEASVGKSIKTEDDKKKQTETKAALDEDRRQLAEVKQKLATELHSLEAAKRNLDGEIRKLKGQDG